VRKRRGPRQGGADLHEEWEERQKKQAEEVANHRQKCSTRRRICWKGEADRNSLNILTTRRRGGKIQTRGGRGEKKIKKQKRRIKKNQNNLGAKISWVRVIVRGQISSKPPEAEETKPWARKRKVTWGRRKNHTV